MSLKNVRQGFVRVALDHPRWVFVGVAALVVGFGVQMRHIRIDTDPENMLSDQEPVRIFHDKAKAQFGLHDTLVVGVANEKHPDGVFNPATLRKVHRVNEAVKEIDGVIPQDVVGLSTVDNIEQAGPGTIRFSWLMRTPPTTRQGALELRDAALRLPMLRGTVVSADGRSVALYVPIARKDQSYRVAQEIQALINQAEEEGAQIDGSEHDRFYITGLPVAEDTFGVEMFKQMAISAPLAGLVIFLLMWVFFRSVALIVSPMLVALATVIITMGALIGSGFTVHIMSSMIPIFLMPIAVVDSVHILSEFVDCYPRFRDKRKAITHVTEHLFAPMLFTSLTSAAGFFSLALTPIPPVRVFGLFVGLGIGLAFLLTMVLIPAYVVRMSDRRLQSLLHRRGNLAESEREAGGPLARIVAGLGAWTLRHAKLVLAAAALLAAVAGYGIAQIEINDNPVRWFHSDHRIRVADRVLNRHLAGTYPAYLVLKAERSAREGLVDAGSTWLTQQGAAAVPARQVWEKLVAQTPTADALLAKVEARADGDERWEPFFEALEEAQNSAKTFQSPEVLAYLARLQSHVEDSPWVGKTSSLADVVKTVHRELRSGDEEDYRIPSTVPAVAQTLLQFQSSHRPDDLWHLVTPDYRESAVWMQLKSGDNQSMAAVKKHVDDYLRQHPLPKGLEAEWAGLTYINVVWQDKMVGGMINSLIGAFVIVFVMMILLFRSIVYGLLSMIPLTLTILLTYGLIGLIGKDYDMPVAVLSSLSLGLSVDFAIHFLERARATHRELGSWRATLGNMFQEPGRAITRNAIVIAIGFFPLLAAPLVPYNTVGFLMAMIMAVSSLVTLMILPSIMTYFKNRRS